VVVWDVVQTCLWPSRCHCHSLSLAPVNPDLFYPSWFLPLCTCSPGWSWTYSTRAVKRLCVCVVGVRTTKRRRRRVKHSQTTPTSDEDDTPHVHPTDCTPTHLFTKTTAPQQHCDECDQQLSEERSSTERNPDIETLGELLTDDDDTQHSGNTTGL